MIKMIFSDFDGTLLRSDHTVSKETIDTVKRYRDAGGIFVIITGRMYRSIAERAKELNLGGYIGAYQGAMICNLDSGEIVQNAGIDSETAKKICREIDKTNYHINLYIDDELYMSRDDELGRYYAAHSNVPYTVFDCPSEEFIAKKSGVIQKILMLVEKEEKEACFAFANETFGGISNVSTSAANLVEMTAKGTSKGTALVELAKRYNVPLSKTAAVGDNLNDAPMVVAAGLGAAVANAADELKECADVVVPSNNDDGVAYLIKKYGLGENV